MPNDSRKLNNKLSTLSKGSKALLLILFLVSCFLFPVSAQSPSPAQTTPLEKAQNDYSFQFTKYREAQEKYITARASYLSFKTAVSKNDAFAKTKDYLTQIDLLYLSFVALVQENANSINWGKSGTEKDEVGKILNAEITYINEHKQKVQNTKTLEELPLLSKELKTHIKDTLEPKLNKTLATFEVVETESAFEDFSSLSRILDRVVIFKLNAGETKSILANWASEIKDIRDKTSDKAAAARKKLDEREGDTLPKGNLEDISEITQSAKTELKRSMPLFEEVVRIL